MIINIQSSKTNKKPINQKQTLNSRAFKQCQYGDFSNSSTTGFKRIALLIALALGLISKSFFAYAVTAPKPTSSLVVSVLTTGATPNDNTDDTSAIQSAINKVKGTGGTVLVPNGTYRINARTAIKPGSNMTFKMNSGAVLKAIPNALGSLAF
jgi:hypothetical protein